MYVYEKFMRKIIGKYVVRITNVFIFSNIRICWQHGVSIYVKTY